MPPETDHTPPTRVVLRPLGSAMPFGFAGLAIASIVSAGYALGWVSVSEGHTVALLLLVTVVPAQAFASVFGLLSRDGGLGGAMGLQAVTWAAFAATLLTAPPGSTNPAVGLAMVSGGALIALSGVTTARTRFVPGAAIALSGLHFVAIGIYELAAVEGWQNAAGAIALAAAALAGYASWAAELEDMADRTIVPTGRRGAGRAAISAPFAEQIAGVANEPGVRRQI